MLTVLMATLDRKRILSQVLEAYTCLASPASGWKLVIVDNGSSDLTCDLVRSFECRLPVTYRCEPRAGKNHALNAGLDCIEGDLVVFTDDDAFPQKDWLLQLREAADAHPSFDIFGGAVRPRWEASPPPWVAWLDPGPVFTLTSPDLPEGPLLPGLVFGPNMAVRADIFRNGVRFDGSIGPAGTEYPMGSETELTLRLASLGHRAWHVPGAVVEHLIREPQLHKFWVMRRAIRFGRGQYRLHEAHIEGPTTLAVPAPVFRELVAAGIGLLIDFFGFDGERTLKSRWQVNFLWGKFLEARRVKREAP